MKRKAVLFLALWVFSGAAAVRADQKEVEYYAILVDGQKIGHVVLTRSIADGVVTTSEDMSMTLVRGGMSLPVQTVETAVETVDGRPLGFQVEQKISGMGQKITGKLVNGEVEVAIEAMARCRRNRWPGRRGR